MLSLILLGDHLKPLPLFFNKLQIGMELLLSFLAPAQGSNPAGPYPKPIKIFVLFTQPNNLTYNKHKEKDLLSPLFYLYLSKITKGWGLKWSLSNLRETGNH